MSETYEVPTIARITLRQMIAIHKTVELSVSKLENDIRKLRGNGDEWERNIEADERESVLILYKILIDRRAKLTTLLDCISMSVEQKVLDALKITTVDMGGGY